MEITFTKEDIELVEKFIDIKNRGMYCDAAQLTNAYNRILHKSVNTTSCGSCLRQRTQELEDALNRFKRLSEASKEVEVNNIPQEENASLDAGATNVETKAVTEQKKEDMKERMARVRAAKLKKK